MKPKYVPWILIVALLAAVVTVGCGSDEPVSTTRTAPGTSDLTAGKKVFTTAELSKFDGKNGNKAYVAVDGVVYDVSGSSYWTGGMHTVCGGGSAAGKDMSELIKRAPPRMRTNLQRFEVVGSLED